VIRLKRGRHGQVNLGGFLIRTKRDIRYRRTTRGRATRCPLPGAKMSSTASAQPGTEGESGRQRRRGGTRPGCERIGDRSGVGQSQKSEGRDGEVKVVEPKSGVVLDGKSTEGK